MPKLTNPLRALTHRDRCIWLCSLLIPTVTRLLFPGGGLLPLLSAWIGVSSLIFAAKGHPAGQLLMLVFSLFYGLISLRVRYYGEMLTYLGMTAPMAAVSLVTWLRHPADSSGTVAVRQSLSRKNVAVMFGLTAAATAVFGVLLAALHTAALPVSILSVATSFLAAYLTALRSPYFALLYAANDIVLLVLWAIAAAGDPGNLPVAACFGCFLFNDLYGFLCWRKMAAKQRA